MLWDGETGPCRANEAGQVSKVNAASNKLKLVLLTAEHIKHLPGGWCLAMGKNVLSGEHTQLGVIGKET